MSRFGVFYDTGFGGLVAKVLVIGLFCLFAVLPVTPSGPFWYDVEASARVNADVVVVGETEVKLRCKRKHSAAVDSTVCN